TPAGRQRGRVLHSGGELGYNASKARKYAIEQMIARNEARRLAQSRESAVKKFNS
ncbi:conjugal transfer protein TrbL, partial [Klebsiella pneumoniae]|nr:conjugal transfer protein TrbL [Klebsiella pneumoniae]